LEALRTRTVAGSLQKHELVDTAPVNLELLAPLHAQRCSKAPLSSPAFLPPPVVLRLISVDYPGRIRRSKTDTVVA